MMDYIMKIEEQIKYLLECLEFARKTFEQNMIDIKKIDEGFNKMVSAIISLDSRIQTIEKALLSHGILMKEPRIEKSEKKIIQ